MDDEAGVWFTPDDLLAVVEGAAVLGSGGGGPQAEGRHLVEVIAEASGGRGVRVVAPDDLPGDALGAVAADIGSATTYVPDQELATLAAFDRLADDVRADHGFDVVLPVEIGPENSLAACAVAALRNRPVLDVDGCGRAVPRLPLVGFDLVAGAGPVVLGAPTGETVTLHTGDSAAAEELLRPVISDALFAASAGLALWPMTVDEAASAGIGGGLARARAVGRALAEARRCGDDPVAAVLAVDGVTGREVARGFVTEVEVVEAGAFSLDRVVLSTPDGPDVTVYAENENLLAWRSDDPTPLATAPDLLSWLTADGRGISNAELDEAVLPGGELILLGLAADASLHREPMATRWSGTLRDLGYAGPPITV